MAQRKWQIISCTLLILLSLIAFEDLRTHQFINLDDDLYITENPQVRSGLTLEGLSWAFTTMQASNWHPLTWLSHMLDCQLFGLNPGPHHLVNLLLHIANTLLLFMLLLRITQARGPSLLVAALFALHPLHVESVAWAAERKDVLSTLFWMLTMWAYVWYVESPGPLRYLLILLVFSLGLMAKPMLVTLPFVLLLLDYWPLGRMPGTGTDAAVVPKTDTGPKGGPGVPLKGLILEKVPLLALAAISSLVTVYAQKKVMHPLMWFSISSRLANVLVAYVSYLGKAIWPSHLAVFYPLKIATPSWQIVGAAFTLITLSVIIIRQSRRRPYLLVGWLWFLGTLVPVIGLVQVGLQAMADRYTYVPFIGLFIIFAWGLADLTARWRLPRYLPVMGAGAILLTFMICTWLRVGYWRDSISLFEHTLKVTSKNYFIHNNLGVALSLQGKTAEAMAHYEESVRLAPKFAGAHNNLGRVLASQGKLDEAIAQFQTVLRLEPNNASAHNNLAVSLASQGKMEQSAAHFKEYFRLQPDSNSVEGHFKLGMVLDGLGEVDEAISHYQEAIRLKPDFPQALNNLAYILASAADPKFRDGAKAVQLAERANQLCEDPAPTLMDTLAVAYAEAGRFPEAIKTSQKAIDLARASNEEDLAKAIEARMSLYRAGRPYRAGQGN
jgi:protein O-mannosyl-transferase